MVFAVQGPGFKVWVSSIQWMTPTQRWGCRVHGLGLKVCCLRWRACWDFERPSAALCSRV